MQPSKEPDFIELTFATMVDIASELQRRPNESPYVIVWKNRAGTWVFAASDKLNNVETSFALTEFASDLLERQIEIDRQRQQDESSSDDETDEESEGD